MRLWPARTASRFLRQNNPGSSVTFAGSRLVVAAQAHVWEIIMQRGQVRLRRQDCLVLQFVLVYICHNRRRTGIWIVGPVDRLIPGVAVESRNSQSYDGKAGWPPQRTE